MTLRLKDLSSSRVVRTLLTKTTPFQQLLKTAGKRPFLLQGRRYFSDGVNTGWLSQKERGEEEFATNKHDQELLKAMREDLARKKKTDAADTLSMERSAMKIEPETEQELYGNRSRGRENVRREAPIYPTTVSVEEFMDFKKDMVKRIRDLEDDLEDLRSQMLRRR